MRQTQFSSLRVPWLVVLLAVAACGQAVAQLKLPLRYNASSPGNRPSLGAALYHKQVHSWLLEGTATCRGAVVVELWEDVEAARAATPLLPGSFFCPLVTTQKYKTLSEEPQGPGKNYRRWFENAHNFTRARNVFAEAAHTLHWDAVACSRQLPYHRITVDASQGTVQANKWWLLVVNTRGAVVPSYHVRATCATMAPQHCAQPDLEGKPCSDAGTCKLTPLDKVTDARCFCEDGRVGVGCESRLTQLGLVGQSFSLQPVYDPYMKAVASATINKPWSVFQIRMHELLDDPLVNTGIILELAANWSGVSTPEQARQLARPRLCFGSQSIMPTLANDRLEPSLMNCMRPLSFPLGYRAAVLQSFFNVYDGYKELYVLVMDVGTDARFRARIAPDTSTGQPAQCPFQCSGQAVCNSLYFQCQCKGNEGPFCDFVENGPHVSVFPKQQTSLLLHGNLKSGSTSWPALQVAYPSPSLTPAAAVTARGYWVRHDPRLAHQSPGLATMYSFESNELLGRTDLNASDGARPDILCITKEMSMDQFQPICNSTPPAEGGLVDLVVILRGNSTLHDQATLAIQWNDTSTLAAMRPRRTLYYPSRYDVGKQHAKRLTTGVIIGIIGGVLVAASLCALVLTTLRRNWAQEAHSDGAVHRPNAIPAGALMPAGRRRPSTNKRGLPAALLSSFPTHVYQGHDDGCASSEGSFNLCVIVHSCDPSGTGERQPSARFSQSVQQQQGQQHEQQQGQEQAQGQGQGQVQAPDYQQHQHAQAYQQEQRQGQVPEQEQELEHQQEEEEEGGEGEGEEEGEGEDEQQQQQRHHHHHHYHHHCQQERQHPEEQEHQQQEQQQLEQLEQQQQQQQQQQPQDSTAQVEQQMLQQRQRLELMRQRLQFSQLQHPDPRAPSVSEQAAAVSHQGMLVAEPAQTASERAVSPEPQAKQPSPGSEPALSDHMCTICLAEYQAGDLLRRLPCLHSFHRDCIDIWLSSHSTCPFCRLELLQQSNVEVGQL